MVQTRAMNDFCVTWNAADMSAKLRRLWPDEVMRSTRTGAFEIRAVTIL
jgi:hypothetical protein